MVKKHGRGAARNEENESNGQELVSNPRIQNNLRGSGQGCDSGESGRSVVRRSSPVRITRSRLRRRFAGRDFKSFSARSEARGSGRTGSKIMDLPLFPGYLFCRLNSGRAAPLLTTPGFSVPGRSGKNPEPVDETEIAGIQAVLRSGLTVTPWPQPGRRDRKFDSSTDRFADLKEC